MPDNTTTAQGYDEAPISLQALDAVRRCAETDMRRRFDGDASAPRSPKRARVAAAAADVDDDGDDDGANPSDDDDAPAFREVARFAYAAVEWLYGGRKAPPPDAADADDAAPSPPLAFLGTCDMRFEKSAIREAERLLGYGRLAPVKLACRGVSLLLVQGGGGAGAGADADDGGRASLAAAERVLRALQEGTTSQRPRFCHRVQPVGATCSALDLEAVNSAARRVCEAYRRAEEKEGEEGEDGGGGKEAAAVKFSVVFKSRHEAARRAEIIRAAAAGVEAAYAGEPEEGQVAAAAGDGKEAAAGDGKAPRRRLLPARPLAVDLKNPDWVLFADVLPVAARPRDPLLVLSAGVPARLCALGSSNTHFGRLGAGRGGVGGGGGGRGKKKSDDASPARAE
jgi:hypothetical protein